MSFRKKNINDYIKDIPMRFSNNFSQLLPESQSNSILNLNRCYVDRLKLSDIDYDFNVERIALQDAEREHERVLKEAEEKLKELKLNKQLNETQVKKPIEDVINSSKPIQLSNYNATSTNFNNSFFVTTNQPAVPNYNSFNYNNSVCQESTASKQRSINLSTQINLISQPNTSQQTCSSQPNQQSQTEMHSNLTTSMSQNKPTTTNLTSTNYYSTNSPTNSLTANMSINLPPNQSNHLKNEQLTKNYSDDLSHTCLANTMYNASTQLYSQSNQSQTSNLSNYNANYNPYVNSSIDYLSNATSSINRMPNDVYNNAINSNPYMLHLNHNLPNNLNQNINPNLNRNLTDSNLNQNSPQNSHQNNQNVTSGYNVNNYVPSSSTYTNGILLPQQSIANNSQETATNCRKDDPKRTATISKPTNDGACNSAVAISMPNSSTHFNNDVAVTTNPFIKSNSKKIDVTDFENSSSPFDDALLRSIDDKEELNNIFQQFYNGAK